MKNLNLILCFLAFPVVFGQDYARIDATIELYPESFDNIEDLSAMISRDFSTEEEKVRGIYSWIIRNVAYDPDEYKKFNYNFKNYRERNSKEEKVREQTINRTLSKGIAVCEGYAMLFEKLCTLQGISNYLVRGDIKTHFNDIGRPFEKIHMWNVAVIDGQGYLFDPTWGAGKYQGRFIKEPTYFYYKTPPELFIKTHYPELQEDTFLGSMVPREVYAKWPLIIIDEMTQDDIEMPLTGIIDPETSLGQIDFGIRWDTTVAVSYSFGNEKVEVTTSDDNGLLRFAVPFELGQRNLLIYFNDEPAIAFKVK